MAGPNNRPDDGDPARSRKSGDGTVGKALEVLDQVASFGRPVRFTELLEQSPYPKATLYRFVQTLTSQRMLSFDATTQTYNLGFRLVRLAHNAWRQASLAPVARSYIDDLSRDIEQTVHLAQLDGGQVLYVDKRNARKPLDLYSQTGKIGPAYCTGVGKAMLANLPEPELSKAIAMQSFHAFTASTLTSESALRAELEEVRKEGHAFDREEHEPNIICIAVPILTTSGQLLGALSVTNSMLNVSLVGLSKLAPTLKQTARQIAREAEHWHFPQG